MAKKVKKYILLIIFSFVSSLLTGKAAEAMKVCLFPKNSDGKLLYQGSATDKEVASLGSDCATY